MKKLLYIAAALLVLAGCNNKEEENGTQNEPANYGTITGKIELPQGEDAKIGARHISAPTGWEAMAEAFTMQWESGDAIYIYNGQECKQLSNPSITNNIATFEGELLDNMSSYNVAYGDNPMADVTSVNVPYIAGNYRPFGWGTGSYNSFTIDNFGPVIGLQLKGTGALSKIEVVVMKEEVAQVTYTMTPETAIALSSTATKVYFPLNDLGDADELVVKFYKNETVFMSQEITVLPAKNEVSVYPILELTFAGQLGTMENTTLGWK